MQESEKLRDVLEIIPREIEMTTSNVLTASPFDWHGDRATAPGTQPFTTDQGTLPTCSSHAVAKAVMDWLDNKGFDADHSDILVSLLALFGEGTVSHGAPGARPVGVATSSPPVARHLQEFHDRHIRIVEKLPDGTSSGRVITVKIRIKTNKTHNKHWGPDTNPFLRSPYDFLAVGVLQMPEGNHAVFVKYYNPKTRMVKTINSHGQRGELGPSKDGWVEDTQFHELHLVRITKISA